MNSRRNLSQTPEIVEVIKETNIKTINRSLLIIPACRAKLAKTIPGPPLAFIVIPKSKEVNQFLEAMRENKATLNTFIMWRK